MAKALPAAKKTVDAKPPEKGEGPPEATDTWWNDSRSGLRMMFRSMPPKGHRPIVYIDVKRGDD